MELELSSLNRSVVHVNTAHAVLTTCVMCTMTAIQDNTEMCSIATYWCGYKLLEHLCNGLER